MTRYLNFKYRIRVQPDQRYRCDAWPLDANTSTTEPRRSLIVPTAAAAEALMRRWIEERQAKQKGPRPIGRR